MRCDAALDSIGLAVSKAERVAALPDVPTFAEAGVADFLVSTWFGLCAPASTPAPVIAKLGAALQSALQDAALSKAMRERDIDPMPLTAAAFTQFTAQERERWRAVVRQAGIKAE